MLITIIINFLNRLQQVLDYRDEGVQKKIPGNQNPDNQGKIKYDEH